MKTKTLSTLFILLIFCSCNSPEEPVIPKSEPYVPKRYDIPELLSPEKGEVLDNGRTDRKDCIKWRFIWSPISGVTKYNLYVKHMGSSYPIIDKELTFIYRSLVLSYDHECYGCYIIDKNHFNWKWKVRAYVNDMWCDWSEERSFDVEPVNTDPPSNE